MRLFLFFSLYTKKRNQYDLNFISIILTKRKSKNQNLIFGSSKANALGTLSGDRRVCFFEKITFLLVTALLIFTMLISLESLWIFYTSRGENGIGLLTSAPSVKFL